MSDKRSFSNIYLSIGTVLGVQNPKGNTLAEKIIDLATNPIYTQDEGKVNSNYLSDGEIIDAVVHLARQEKEKKT